MAVVPQAKSGLQHEIGAGPHRAVVTEVGATLREYSYGGRDVIAGFTSREMSPDGRGQVLAPWPNRLGGGAYSFEGVTTQAALNEPSASNAIHGLVRWLPWHLESRGTDAVAMGCILHPQPGYPWRLRLTVEYRIGGSGLVATATAENEGDSPAPFGIGFHPYLSAGAPAIDSAHLRLEARSRLTSDERGLPTGAMDVAGSEYDFSTGRAIGSARLDTAFSGLARDGAGVARVELERADGARISVWMDESFPWVMVYSADHLAAGRRESLAIEPMSCPPDAFRSGVDLVRLAPGASWTGRWGISPS
jgi:aldose 1-epimerase